LQWLIDERAKLGNSDGLPTSDQVQAWLQDKEDARMEEASDLDEEDEETEDEEEASEDEDPAGDDDEAESDAS
jgi:hypothetical protein